MAIVSMNPVYRSRLHEEIIGQIRNKILSGELDAGQKLPAERELAASLNVNRATLREALKKLEMLGLIEILHGDGIYVRNYLESGNIELLKTMLYIDEKVDADVLSYLLQIRRILTPEMAAIAAVTRTEIHLEELRAVIAAENEDSILEADLKVHHIIGKAGRNLLYIFILNFFNQVYRDYGYLYFNDGINVARSIRFHKDIYAAIYNRDAEGAKLIMREIMEYSEEMIYRNIGTLRAGSAPIAH